MADKILNLPDDVVRRILSLVSTADAFQMNNLSMTWRRSWKSLPVLDLDETIAIDDFSSFVDQCLTLRRDDIIAVGATPIKRFRLAINPSRRASVLNRCLELLSYSRVEELALNSLQEVYFLYGNVLPANSLTRLRLTNVNAEDLHWVDFPVLKSMSLEGVRSDDLVLHQTLSRCPVLEELTLSRCTGLYRPEFSIPSLKFLRVDCTIGPKASVAAANLESFVYDGPQPIGTPEPIEFSDASLRNIKSLYFYDAASVESLLKRADSLLPRLESLTLHCKMSRFEIRSDSLKQCVFSTERERARFKIDAPNLVYLSIEGCRVELSLLNGPKISEADVEFRETEYDLEWYDGLVRFLRQLGCSTEVNLRVHSHQALMIPEEVRIGFEAPICDVKELFLDVKEPSTRNEELKDIFHWLTNRKA